MGISTTERIHQDFQKALKHTTCRVVGHEDIFDLAEIQVMTAILNSYGQSEHGFIYAEPALLDAHIPPPDLVLAHPKIGLMVFECKAYSMDFIHGAEAGSLKIMRYGREKLVNPLKQAQRGMFAIKDAFERFTYRGARPLFHAMVVLPNITEQEWCELGYHNSIDTRFILFQEHLRNASLLQKCIYTLVENTISRLGIHIPLPNRS